MFLAPPCRCMLRDEGSSRYTRALQDTLSLVFRQAKWRTDAPHAGNGTRIESPSS